MAASRAEMSSKRMQRAARRGSVSLTHLAAALESQVMPAIAGKVRQSTSLPEDGHRWVWIEDSTYGYAAGKLLDQTADQAQIIMARGGEHRTIRPDAIKFELHSIAGLNEPLADMVKMDEVNEATILYNLRARFLTDDIYTNIGTILVSVNPFKWMDTLYTKEYVEKYLHLQAGEETDPHVFAVANAAFQGLRGEQQDQSIIISGESGAGKTEATKKCLQFFAEAAGSGGDNMEKRLLSANPILEAFGNAKTVRNNNSSRFGKWMAVLFDGRAQICGCRIINYLLEKSRVVSQAKSERNYHIFYQLCCGASAAMKTAFGLSSITDYVSCSSCVTVPGVDDAEDFRQLMDAFELLAFEPSECDSLFVVTAAVLHLGNMQFVSIDADSSAVKPPSESKQDHIALAAKLLQVNKTALQEGLVTKVLATRGGQERVVSRLSAPKAVDACNSLSKALYGRMFDWLVIRVNKSLENERTKNAANVIGVLDIFGFEIFEHNSFEQLCINYCNEKLQQHFNTFVFKAEEECYKSEGIDYSEVKFIDNADVLDLIEKRPSGLLPMLDDEIIVPKGSDATWLTKVSKVQEGNTRYKSPTDKKSMSLAVHQFGVHHYAGVVVYDSTGFLEKNRDALSDNLRELMEGSGLPFISQQLFAPDPEAAAAKASGRSNRPKSQSGQFKQQLDSLMQTLFATNPHYIRCVKPNNEKVADVFDAPLCLQQLRYAGVFEAVKIRQQGFPFRWTHRVFYSRYRCLGGPAHTRKFPMNPDFVSLSKALLAVLADTAPETRECRFGRTMVLYRAGPHRRLESLREKKRITSVIVCQRLVRGHLGRRRFARIHAARERLREAMEDRKLVTLGLAIDAAMEMDFHVRDLKPARALHKRLVEEKECRDAMTELLQRDPVDFYEKYVSTIATAEALGFRERGEEALMKLDRKFATVEQRRQAKTHIDDGIKQGDRDLIQAGLDIAKELAPEFGDILHPEIRARADAMLKVIAEEDQVLAQVREAVSVGLPVGEIGQLDESFITTKPLEAALTACRGSSTIKTQRGTGLIKSAERLLALRHAFVAREWAMVESLVEETAKAVKSGAMSKEVAREVAIYTDEVTCRRVLDQLTTALMRGGPSGVVGALVLTTVSVVELDKALAAGDASGWKSRELQTLRQVANLVRAWRVGMIDGQWRSVEASLQACKQLQAPEFVEAEMRLAQDELENQRILLELAESLEIGMAVGPVGALDTSGVATAELEARLRSALQAGAKSEKSRALVDIAKAIVPIRKALVRGDWDDTAVALSSADGCVWSFSPCSGQEVRMVRYEIEDHKICAELDAAIGMDGYISSGPDFSAVSTRALQDALATAHSLTPRSSRAKWNQMVAAAVLELRSALTRMDWVAVEDASGRLRNLDGAFSLPDAPINAVGEQDMSRWGIRHSLPRYTLHELHCVSVLHDEVVMTDAMMEALVNLAPSGAVKELHFPPNCVSSAADAVALAERLGPKSDRARTLLQHTKFVLSLRPLAMAGKWREIERILKTTGVDCGSIPRDSIPIGEGFGPELPEALRTLPEQTQKEVFAYAAEVDNIAVLSALVDALGSGGPTGTVGKLNLRAVEIDGFVTAKRLIARRGCKTPEAEQLLLIADNLQSLRQALMDSDWDRVDALNTKMMTLLSTRLRNLHLLQLPEENPMHCLRFVYEELTKVQQELQNRRTVELLVGVLRTGQPTGTIGDIRTDTVDLSRLSAAIEQTKAVGCVTDRARVLLESAVQLFAVRSALVSGDWKQLEQLYGRMKHMSATSGQSSWAAPEVIDELAFVQNEMHNRRIVEELTAVLCSGSAQGSVGQLDVSCCDVEGMDGAIRLAQELGVKTEDASLLLASAKLIRRLREALVTGNYQRLAQVLREADGMLLSEFVAAEMAVAQDEVNNRLVMQELSNALSCGMAVGPIGQLDRTRIVLGDLKRAVMLTMRLGAQTADAQQLLLTARVVLRLRQALLREDYEEAQRTIAAVAAQTLAAIAMHEIQAIQDEVDYVLLTRELTAALSTGAPGGPIGALDVSVMQVNRLRAALQIADDVGVKTDDARALVSAAQMVLQLRTAVMNADWAVIKTVLETAHSSVLSPVAIAEIQRMDAEVDNRFVLQTLEAAVMVGGPSGHVGNLNVTPVSMTELDRAIATVVDVGCVTDAAENLLQTAKFVRRLRSALQVSNWEWVAQVLEENVHAVAECARDEVELVAAELHNRQAVTMLTSAMRHGRIGGSVGQIETTNVRVGALHDAIAFSEQFPTRSPECAVLLHTAILLLKLRQAMIDQNYDLLSSITSTIVMSDIAEEMRPEIALIMKEASDWGIFQRIRAALARGRISGLPGHVDRSVIATEDVDAAIEECMRTGVFTKRAKQMLLAAMIVRRLRAAVVQQDWEFVRQVLDEAEAEWDRLVPEAREEADCARRELEFQFVVKVLERGLQDRSEIGLLEGLEGARKLDLQDGHHDYALSLASQASSMLDNLEHCQGLLRVAIEAVNEEQLSTAVSSAHEIGLSSPLVHTAEELLSRVRQLSEAAALALKLVDRPAMEEVLADCAAINLVIPEITSIQMMLELPDDQFLQRQLGAAVALGDVDKVTSLTMHIKDGFFRECSNLFQLHKFPNLKPPQMFSKRYGLTDPGLRSHMLRFTSEPIHTSLTRLPDTAVRRIAIRTFRCIMGFMGDRDASDRLQQCRELLGEGLRHSVLRDEIYVQLTKQLTGNPSPDSTDMGWVLMEICLTTFPPSEDFENYLEFWLREHHATPCVEALHRSVFRGPLADTPTKAELAEAVRVILGRLRVAIPEGLEDTEFEPPRRDMSFSPVRSPYSAKGPM